VKKNNGFNPIYLQSHSYIYIHTYNVCMYIYTVYLLLFFYCCYYSNSQSVGFHFSIESPELHNSTTPQSGRSPTVTGRGLPGPAVE